MADYRINKVSKAAEDSDLPGYVPIYRFLRKSGKAVLTMEAALTVPVFLLVVIGLFEFFIMINYQNILQKNMYDASGLVARNAYLLERIQRYGAKAPGEVVTDIEKKNGKSLISGEKELLVKGINTAFLLKEILSEEVRTYTKTAGVYGGIGGLSMAESIIGGKDGINDIRLQYVLGNGLPGKRKLLLANRCYFRTWIGESIQKGDGNHEKKRIVYVTKNGEVYHCNRNCTYIRIEAIGVPADRISEYRNDNKCRYKPCKACMYQNRSELTTVYITPDGTRYHRDNRCSKIRREVKAVDLSEVGSRRPCSKCGR